MFTGIIEAIGEIAAMEAKGEDMRLRVRTGKLSLDDVALGDSISTNGVCLTVTDLPGDGYWADVSGETLAHTTLGNLTVGCAVNLEKALLPTSRLGGHLVSGHVDGVGQILRIEKQGRAVGFTVRAPGELARYIAHKGSICVDGTSLTVNAVNGAEFELTIIPQTLQETLFGHYQAGTSVNLEVDVIARYLERLLTGEQSASKDQINAGFLAQHGYMKT